MTHNTAAGSPEAHDLCQVRFVEGAEMNKVLQRTSDSSLSTSGAEMRTADGEIQKR